MRKLAALVLVVLFVLPAPTARAEDVTLAQLAEAEAKVREFSVELEGRLGALEAAMYEEWLSQDRIDSLRTQIADRERRLVLAAFAAREQAVDLYMNYGNDQAAGLDPEELGRAGTRDAYMRTLVAADRDAVNELEFLKEDAGRLQAELEERLVSQGDQQDELQRQVDLLLGELDVANAEYQALADRWWREEQGRIAAREAAARAAAAAAAAATAAASGYATSEGTPTAGRTCPVAGPHTFRDSWLEPRPGGRVHHGLDMVAAMGTPLVAVETGVVYGTGWHYLGGINLYLRGDSTDVYYYAHLSGYASGISDGVRVNKGQTIGYVGDTGNAGVPHLHLGYQPAGGPLTNPYQLMVRLCR